jgi:hypothetical protein
MSALPGAGTAPERPDYLDLETAGFRMRGVSQMLHARAASSSVPDHLQSALVNLA